MEILDFFRKRKSIRQFTKQKVSDNFLDKIITAAELAPSAGNLQPWRFIVVKDEEMIKLITESTYQGASSTNPPQSWIKEADLLLVVCIDNQKTVEKYGEMGAATSAQDVAAAVENILLAAAGLDLGACWIAGFREAEIRPILQIPEQVQLTALIPLGHTEFDPPRRKRLPRKEILFYEKYNNNKI